MGRYRKQLLTALKILISLALLYFIFTKLPFKEISAVLKQARFEYLLLALLLFIISKSIASVRLNSYFHQIGAPLSELQNGKLYLQGMFYNLFLPGGIGGDAYKGYRIQQDFSTGTKKVVASLLADRLSGLLMLFILACAIALFIEHSIFTTYSWAFPILAVLALGIFWWVNKRYFPSLFPVFWKSILLSTGVQLAQLVAVFCILLAFEIAIDKSLYLFIFLVSSIVAVLPLTIGGIGSREVVFLYGALWLGLEEDVSVSISLVFLAITALVSFAGLYYHLKPPQLTAKE
ncbi:MAG: flippase-like domain-containing protein [Flavobacteriaceae bacterium]|nr:flippase-like domain-containing protein [Flavobacteriaceae bacterium]